ncbi:MAG: zinc-ribbon domain-containing protein [Planctomycetota bacterium]|jgi:predicted Zn finger-like uncharacterized protein
MQIECPECSTSYELPDEYVGKKLKCKKCESVFEVEAEEEIAEVAETPEEEPGEAIEEGPEEDEVLFDMEEAGTEMPDINNNDFEISFEDMPEDEGDGEEPEESDDEEKAEEEEIAVEEETDEKPASLPASVSRRKKKDSGEESSDDDPTEDKPAKKASKVPVIILAVLCILFAGAGGGMGYLWQEAEKKIGSSEDKADSASAKAKAKEKEVKEAKAELDALSSKLSSLKKEKVLFYDGFDTSLINDRWLPNKDTTIEHTPKGRMKIRSKGSAIAFCKTGFKGNVRIEYDAKISPLEGDKVSDLSFIIAADIAKPMEKGYFFGIGCNGNTKTKVTKKNDAIFLKDGSPVTAGGIYHFRVECVDGGITVYMSDIKNKTPEKAIIELDKARLPPKGYYFGYYTWNSELLVDRVKVVKLD